MIANRLRGKTNLNITIKPYKYQRLASLFR